MGTPGIGMGRNAAAQQSLSALFPLPLAVAGQTAAQVNLNGALLDPLTPQLQHKINAQVADGAFISSVYPDSAAERAGLQAGDIIFKVDGRWVMSPQEVIDTVGDYMAGDNIRLGVYSGGRRRNVYLVLSGQNTGAVVPQ